jgi:hypothetical protein
MRTGSVRRYRQQQIRGGGSPCGILDLDPDRMFAGRHFGIRNVDAARLNESSNSLRAAGLN